MTEVKPTEKAASANKVRDFTAAHGDAGKSKAPAKEAASQEDKPRRGRPAKAEKPATEKPTQPRDKMSQSKKSSGEVAPKDIPTPEPEQPAQEQPADSEPEQAQEEQPQEEQPARDPKQARGPVPDKAFVGLEIKGKGWKIVFDGSYDRTRVIFKRKPSNAAREALDKHGFFWSPAMQSWNKKLTHKAFRAAQALALELRTICG